MYYTREQHKRFLDKELIAISEAYLKLLNSKAIALLSSNELYVTQFVKLNENGTHIDNSEFNILGSSQLLLRFKKDKGIPRKNEYFTAVLLEANMSIPQKWNDLTWADLRKHQVEFSEVHCVWHGKEDNRGFLLCGFSGISLDMANYLKEKKLEGCVIVLGPKEPPLEYYQNLIGIVTDTSPLMPAKCILDFDSKKLKWQPENINSNKEQIEKILKTLETKEELIFQGPPGTGKTYLMAQLASTLLSKGKSVLVTAMTNRALIELAVKDSLKEHLVQGNIMKTNVSSDEKLLCKNIDPIGRSEVTCIPGKLTLSTFYISSGWANYCYKEQPFDYVIMDEASQALFAMIAACKNLGKKVIWIGDQNQMQPIVLLSEESIIRNDYGKLANGFQTLCDNFDYKSYILTESRRLLPKAAELTSLFYHIDITSTADFDYLFKTGQIGYFPTNGGTSLLTIDLPIGQKADRANCMFAIKVVEDVLKIYPKLKIAVLSKFRASVRMLQNCFLSELGNKDNVLIDTVERVQGMTCDVCVYFIPNTMIGMSLEKPLFNVATSRATQATIIIADEAINSAVCDKNVQEYIQCLNGLSTAPKHNDNSQGETNLSIEGAGINLKLKGKIDLSQFETPKQKSVKSQTKENIYIIDTNVFVNAPDIISKIDKQYKIVLSAKVIDELDKLKIKLTNKEKQNVEKALRNINRAMDQRNITMELSNPDLLPEDFNKKSPDNNILTVALKFKNENPILLTSDNGLQVKAKGLGISTISLKDFLK